MLNSNTIIRLPEAIQRTGLSRSTIYSLISRDEFVTKIKLSPRAMGFLSSDVDLWITSRVEASKAGA